MTNGSWHPIVRQAWRIVFLWAMAFVAGAQETALPRPASLPDAARTAVQRGRPLVVLVSLPGCAYCEQVRRLYLAPLLRDTDGVVQIDLDSSQPVIDFDGVTRSHAAVAKTWKVSLAPTVLLLGPSGRELAERLVGAGVPDFYGAYLEQRLATARCSLPIVPSTECRGP